MTYRDRIQSSHPIPFLSLLVTTLVASLFCTPLLATDLELIEFQIPEQETSLLISWIHFGWSQPDIQNIAFRDAPRLATIQKTPEGLLFTPSPDFYVAGGDTFTVSLMDPLRNGDFDQPVLVTIGPSDNVETLSEDAESGNLGAWTEVAGSVSIDTNHPIQGTGSLAFGYAALGGSYLGTHVSQLRPGDTGGGTGTSNSHVGMVVDLDPPTGGSGLNGLVMQGYSFVLYQALDVLGNTLVEIHLSKTSAQTYDAYATFTDTSCGSPCSTPALSIPVDEPVRLDLFSTTGRVSLKATYGETVDVASVDSGALHEVTTRGHRLGVLSPSAETTGTLLVDSFLHRYFFPADSVRRRRHVDSFENGIPSDPWTLEHPSLPTITAVQTLGMGGSTSMKIDLLATKMQGANSATLVHVMDAPRVRYATSFRFDTSNLGFDTNWQSIVLFGATSVPWQGGQHLILRLVYLHGQYHVFARAQDSAGTFQATSWVPLTGHRHEVVLQWQGGEKGLLRLWVDDHPMEEVRGFDATGHDIERIRFGAIAIPAVPGATHQELILDSWASWSLTEDPDA